MISAIIPIYVVALCNFSHIILAIYFFPSIVEFLDDLHWGFTHRSWFIEYVDDSEVDRGMKHYINHSKHSILTSRADRYERTRERTDVVNYYGAVDKDFEDYLRFRECRKMLQQASDDATLIRKQNFRARVHERMIEQPVVDKPKLARVR